MIKAVDKCVFLFFYHGHFYVMFMLCVRVINDGCSCVLACFIDDPG